MHVPDAALAEPEAIQRHTRRSNLLDFWRTYLQSRLGPVGLFLLVIVTLCAVFAPLIAPVGPFALSGLTLAEPGTDGHLLGTDHLGRDVLAQLVYGARVSLTIGITAALLSLLVGVVIGCLSGYLGGWVDLVLSRITDMFLIIPSFFLIIMVVATLGSNIWYVMIVIGLTSWPSNARLMRGQALTLRERTFIHALTALGERRWRILFKHIIPNGIQPLLANGTIQVAQAILIEAGLSFIGLGDPNRASWGRMIFDGRTTILTAWWPSVFAGIAIMLTVIAFYLIGDGLSYVLTPRSRRAST